MLGLGLGLWRATPGIGGGAEAFSTWNTTDATTYWSLTNSDKTASRLVDAGSWRMVRGTTGHASGKWYFELVTVDTVGNSGNWMLGVANAGASAATYPGGAAYGLGLRNDLSFSSGGQFTAGTGSLLTSSATTAGEAYGFAIDADAGKLWLAHLGTWKNSGDPAAGTNASYVFTPATVGAIFPAVGGSGGGTVSKITLRTKASEFAYSPPSGFSAWG